MAAPQQVIDSYLEDGWYAEWMKMEGQVRGEENRYDGLRRILKLPGISSLYDRIDSDFILLYKVAKDYRKGMDFLVAGRKVSKDKIGKVYDIYTMALGVVVEENDVLEAVFATGFAAAWVVFPFVLLQAQSKGFQAAIEELKKELAKSEKEVANARTKMAVHVVVVFFEALFPEISLTTRAAIYLGDVVMDKALGPEHPTTKQKVVGDVVPGVKQFSEAVHHIPEYGHTAHEIAKKTGPAAAAATFYFDYEELGEGKERRDKIKELLEKAKDAYDKLVRTIEDNQPKLEQFLFAWDRWMRAIDDIRTNAGNVRQALKDDMDKAGYDRYSTWVWPTG